MSKIPLLFGSYFENVPLQVQGLQLWLDAADTGTITESSGSVSQWGDKSGNGNDGEQLTATNQPTTGFSIGGKNAIDFTPIDEGLEVSPSASINNLYASGGSVFLTVNIDDDGGFAAGRLLSKGSWQLLTVQESGGLCRLQFDVTTSGTDGQWITTDRDIIIDQDTIINFSYDTSDPTTPPVIRLNGIESPLTENATPTGTYTDDSASSLYIGNSASLNRGMDGLIGEINAYDKTLNAAENSLIESYLSNKWGITI